MTNNKKTTCGFENEAAADYQLGIKITKNKRHVNFYSFNL